MVAVDTAAKQYMPAGGNENVADVPFVVALAAGAVKVRPFEPLTTVPKTTPISDATPVPELFDTGYNPMVNDEAGAVLFTIIPPLIRSKGDMPFIVEPPAKSAELRYIVAGGYVAVEPPTVIVCPALFITRVPANSPPMSMPPALMILE